MAAVVPVIVVVVVVVVVVVLHCFHGVPTKYKKTKLCCRPRPESTAHRGAKLFRASEL